jgi:DNA adenine methylase
MGFAGMFSSSFGYDKQKGKHPLRLKNAKLLITDELIDLLENTTIECDDALKVINRFDESFAFFFIDPPYVGANMGHYSGMFNEQNLSELLELLSKIKGKFMLTMYPHDLIKSFADRCNWKIQVVNRKVMASINSRKDVSEWLVMNY